MGGLSLLAASLVVAALGFGWVNAIKDGVFDVWSAIKGIIHVQENHDDTDIMMDDDSMMKEDGDDAMMHDDAVPEEDIQVDPEYDRELNDLEQELDTLFNESEAELESLEGEL